jgi:hypothetical protein
MTSPQETPNGHCARFFGAARRLRRPKEERQEKLVRFKRLAQHLCNRVSASVSKCGEKNHTIKV